MRTIGDMFRISDLTAIELALTVLFVLLFTVVMFYILRDLLMMLAEINAHLALDPDETGIVSERTIEREAALRYRTYVVTIQKAPLFPFVLLIVLIGALTKGLHHYPKRVSRAVRMYWAY